LTALAKLYADTGDKADAKLTAEKAIQVDPSIKQYADDFHKKPWIISLIFKIK